METKRVFTTDEMADLQVKLIEHMMKYVKHYHSDFVRTIYEMNKANEQGELVGIWVVLFRESGVEFGTPEDYRIGYQWTGEKVFCFINFDVYYDICGSARNCDRSSWHESGDEIFLSPSLDISPIKLDTHEYLTCPHCENYQRIKHYLITGENLQTICQNCLKRFNFKDKIRCNQCMAEFDETAIVYDGEEDIEYCPECGENGCLMDITVTEIVEN